MVLFAGDVGLNAYIVVTITLNQCGQSVGQATSNRSGCQLMQDAPLSSGTSTEQLQRTWRKVARIPRRARTSIARLWNTLQIPPKSQHVYRAATAHLAESGADTSKSQNVYSAAVARLVMIMLYTYMYIAIYLQPRFNEGSNHAGID
uniref:Uncharacterized protein n=1 Tax=mine drainage metagenome TaxID=410659 RepID=E6QXC1_9ZZZZ